MLVGAAAALEPAAAAVVPEVTLVESETMILPCTGRPSFDFLRSRVSISEAASEARMERQARRASSARRLRWGRAEASISDKSQRTVSSAIEIENVRHLHIDDAKEALVALLKLAVIKDLEAQKGEQQRVRKRRIRQALFSPSRELTWTETTDESLTSLGSKDEMKGIRIRKHCPRGGLEHAQIDTLGPVRVQSLLDNLGREGLGTVAGDDRKGIRETVGTVRRGGCGQRVRRGAIRRQGMGTRGRKTRLQQKQDSDRMSSRRN